VSRNAAGNLLVNGGAVLIVAGAATVAASLIQIFGRGGNNILTLNESYARFRIADLVKGAGKDTVTGGSGSDKLFGQIGNDTLLGKGGVDFLFWRCRNDLLTGVWQHGGRS
jgi:Ca2+-binding RTX toxin-like protein